METNIRIESLRLGVPKSLDETVRRWLLSPLLRADPPPEGRPIAF